MRAKAHGRIAVFVLFVAVLAYCGGDGGRLHASGMSGGGLRPGVPATPAVTTANADNYRDSWFSQERVLTPANVGGGSFGKLFTWNAVFSSRLNAQLLVVPGVATSSGQKDLLIGVSMGGQIAAFDANNWNETPVWTYNTPSGYSNTDGLLYNETVACLSTPVADAVHGYLYAACASSAPVWTLYKLSLASGSLAASQTVTGQYPGTGDPNGGDTVIGGQLQFKPNSELQRAALLLANGNVYVGFGSFADQRPWHGWGFAYDASTLAQVGVFCASPSNYGAGFWGAGAGFSADASGNIYVFTGNGHWDGSSAYGESILKLSSTLSLLDFFTPSNWATLESNDSDLSSSRAMLMESASGSTLLVGGAKDYRVYVVDAACMGHLQGSEPSCTAPQLWLTNAGTPGSHVGIYGGAFAANTVFMPNTGGYLFRYSFSPSTGLFNQTSTKSPAQYQFPGAQVSYSSNGAANGVLWATTTASSAETNPQAGTLRAFNPVSMAEIYNSDAIAGDALGQLNKFASPVIWRGYVFLAGQYNVFAFGLGAH